MVRYLDSGDRTRNQTLYAWLEDELPGATYFGCQSGYFTADAFYAFRSEIDGILAGGGDVHLVIGANEDRVAATDLEDVLDVLEPFATQASVVLVSAPDALMHPKTYLIEKPGGYKTAVVGSANFTGSGLGTHIEASLVIDSIDDPSAPFDEVKSAIDVWRTGSRPNGLLLKKSDIPSLVAKGTLVPAPPPSPPFGRSRPGLRKSFPKLGRLVSVPRRRRRTRASRGVPPLAVGGGAPLPIGAVGIVKRLSRLDTKGFRREPGTPYVSLPSDLLPHIPSTPAGRNAEPRWDVLLYARADFAVGHVVDSGTNPTNVTAVGYGRRRASHKDLRLNILRAIVHGIEYVATGAGHKPPRQGDLLAVEFVPGQNALRLTFVTEDPLKSALNSLCTHGSWGWLPAGQLLTW